MRARTIIFILVLTTKSFERSFRPLSFKLFDTKTGICDLLASVKLVSKKATSYPKITPFRPDQTIEINLFIALSMSNSFSVYIYF